MKKRITGIVLLCVASAIRCAPTSPNVNGNNNNDAATGNDNAGSGNGPGCAEYCAAIQGTCGDGTTSAFTAQYPDFNACLAYCQTLAALPSGSLGDDSGNTIGCRLQFAGAAAAVAETIDRLSLCEQAGPSGGNQCGSWCENYCYLAQLNCAGQESFSDDPAACLADCASLNSQGRPGVESGNNVQCRIFYLGEAGNPAPLTVDDGTPLDSTGNPVTIRTDLNCPRGAINSLEPDGSDGPCR